MTGETVYVDGKPVENVLVRVGEHVDETGISVPVGTVVAYTLAFPFDYPGPLRDSKVTVRGVECDVVGHCDHARPQDVFEGMWDLSLCPWDMTVPVKLCGGDMSRIVAVYRIEVDYDDMGDPVRKRTPVYEGMAQARMESGTESAAPDGTVTAAETWWFVVPWDSSFSGLRPNGVEVDMGGAIYDVISVSNVEMRSEFVSMKAVRRG